MKLLKDNLRVKNVTVTNSINYTDFEQLYELTFSIKIFNSEWIDNVVRIWASSEKEALDKLWLDILPNSITIEFNRKQNIFDKVRNFLTKGVSYIENKNYNIDINIKETYLPKQRLIDVWEWLKKNW